MEHVTAISKVRAMLESMPPERAKIITRALREGLHPQVRTRGFHEFYDAPIHRAKPTKTFDHMDDERVAFRLGFLIEELKELFRDGFGIEMDCRFQVANQDLLDRELQGTWADTSALVHVLAYSGKRDLIEVIDGLGDLNVVGNGFALELGVDMDHADMEIAASNFTKADEDGNPIIGDGIDAPKGKVLKGPNYMKPQLARILGL